MNYPNERRTYLNANHRNVAQFSQRSDPSYLAIRNALATTIATKRSLAETSRRKAGIEQLETLNTFLGISDLPSDELECQSLRLPETCDWILERNSFEEWRSASTSKTFWLRGRPGAGKSVLAAHITSHLQELGNDCCYYFFKRLHIKGSPLYACGTLHVTRHNKQNLESSASSKFRRSLA